jgi:hypothetical protein
MGFRLAALLTGASVLCATGQTLSFWERLQFSVDYGDAYRTSAKWWTAKRLLGSVLVVVNSETNLGPVLNLLTNVSGPLPGYDVDQRGIRSGGSWTRLCQCGPVFLPVPDHFNLYWKLSVPFLV